MAIGECAVPPRIHTPHGAAAVVLGKGEPFVLVHGVGLRLEAWVPQIEAFASTHRVIALDLPGHGESTPIGADPRLPDFVAWLMHALDDLGCGPANLCGHSMGALIVLGATLECPSVVLRAALLCGVYRRDADARRAVRARVAAMARGERDVDGPIARWYVPGRSPAEARAAAVTREWLSGVSASGYEAAYRAFAEGDTHYADQIAELAVPSLFLAGGFDSNSTPGMSEEMAVLAPTGRAVVVPGERHMVPLTAPRPVNAALRAWLETPADPVR